MENPECNPLLSGAESPACALHRPEGRSAVVLACEHASNAIPASLNGLGLAPADRTSHAAWDIGAQDLSLALSQRLDAPLVLSRVSRLVHDCNRPVGAPDAIPARSEVIEVPGNRDLTAEARRQRETEVHAPFHALLAEVLAAHPVPPVLVTVHSFTPVYHGTPRAVELGFLHGPDDRLARAMLSAVRDVSGLQSALNAPYGPSDGVLHTLEVHALPQERLNVMIEVRNDLLRTPAQCAAMADTLAAALAVALPVALAAAP
ncbi:N-formylglutamate amidohydrolase [Fluviibacterium sp. DFM31]|uniref:N-formylglutamate amidohydrolase n=1 Tax=Meridianimarinicoccus marinus TaxID=3231483 RepID=A0ABV3L5F9_9RHOB